MTASLLLLAFLLQAASEEPRGSISGRVVSAQGGEGLSGVRVMLSNQAAASQRLTRTAVTGDAGSFTIDRLPAGAYALVIHKQGYRPAQSLPVRVTLEHNQTRSGVEFKLNCPGVITGTVTDADGAPVARAQITADRKSTRLNSSHIQKSRMPSSA